MIRFVRPGIDTEREDATGWRLASALAGVRWPAFLPPQARATLALLQQFGDSERMEPDRMRERQFEQLELVLRHAYATVPYYRARWGGAPRAERLAELPVLSRADLQTFFEGLKSEAVPPEHGEVSEASTSGSSGVPARVRKTALSGLFWSAFTLRDHLWHRRDLSAKLAVIRNRTPQLAGAPERAENWGIATAELASTGSCMMLYTDSDFETLLEKLAQEQPAYLLCYPSVAAELARLGLAGGARLHGLREVRCYGERLEPDLPALCESAWGAKVTDSYSSVELGHLALQCPSGPHLHVQSEGVLLEILDESGKPCPPGEPGRVVATDLHNFAMPLIRYEVGDYAEWGQACVCGRSLPVLARINGRVHDVLVTRDGRRYWPYFNWVGIQGVAPLRAHQFVQKDYELIEARIVTAARLPAEQEERLKRHLLERLPPGMRIELVYCESLPQRTGGKALQFYSEVAK